MLAAEVDDEFIDDHAGIDGHEVKCVPTGSQPFSILDSMEVALAIAWNYHSVDFGLWSLAANGWKDMG